MLMERSGTHWIRRMKASGAGIAILAAAIALPPATAGAAERGEVAYAKDIAPILQRSCQNCHRPSSMAPMSLMTYEEVRPWARSIRQRTSQTGAVGKMPPWFIDKTVGIQDFKDDVSLSAAEIETIGRWVDNGAPRGNPADLPPPRTFAGADEWDIGEPDLIVTTPAVTMAAEAPDWWGALEPVALGIDEDRYVAAMQVKEFSDATGGVGGKFIFHHALMTMLDEDGDTFGDYGWPNTTTGRFGWTFDPEVGRYVKGGSSLLYHSVHLHANGEDTTAYLKVAFKFHPAGYQPTKQLGSLGFGKPDVDLRPMEADQAFEFFMTVEEHTRMTTFGPHMHAPGVRFCIEAIYGGRSETLSCAGYDHNWIRAYLYAEDAAPLLPKGTILRGTGYFDNTPANPNIVDPRNWTGFGHRSIDNMLLHIGPAITLTEEEFQAEVAARRERLGLAPGETVVGCPLCSLSEFPADRPAQDQNQQ